jgi:hypothetical protein
MRGFLIVAACLQACSGGSVDMYPLVTDDAGTPPTPHRVMYRALGALAGERRLVLPLGTGLGPSTCAVVVPTNALQYHLKACDLSLQVCDEVDGTAYIKGSPGPSYVRVRSGRDQWVGSSATGAEVLGDYGTSVYVHVRIQIPLVPGQSAGTGISGIPGQTQDPAFGDLWLYGCPVVSP